MNEQYLPPRNDSKTPRTDEHHVTRLKFTNISKFENAIDEALEQPQSWPDFASQLERELNETMAELEALTKPKRLGKLNE